MHILYMCETEANVWEAAQKRSHLTDCKEVLQLHEFQQNEVCPQAHTANI